MVAIQPILMTLVKELATVKVTVTSKLLIHMTLHAEYLSLMRRRMSRMSLAIAPHKM